MKTSFNYTKFCVFLFSCASLLQCSGSSSSASNLAACQKVSNATPVATPQATPGAATGTTATAPVGREYFNIIPDQHAAEYFIGLSIGGQNVSVVADTGSSNLILTEGYSPGATATNVGRSFPVAYGSGNGIATEYSDQTKISCDTIPSSATFGVLTQNNNLPNILGLGYASLASPPDAPLVPFFDQIVKERTGIGNIFTMTLCGAKSGSTVLLGSTDARVTGQINYVPVIKQGYYVVKAMNAQVVGWALQGSSWVSSPGTTTNIGEFPSDAGAGSGLVTIVDSGTTLNILPYSIFESAAAIMRAVNDAKGLLIPDSYWIDEPGKNHMLLSLSADQIAAFPIIQIVLSDVAGNPLPLSMAPSTYFKELGFGSGNRIFGFAHAQGLNILGQVFMENFSVQFDKTNNRVGFGPNTAICQ